MCVCLFAAWQGKTVSCTVREVPINFCKRNNNDNGLRTNTKFNRLSFALNPKCFSYTKLTSSSNQVPKLQAIFNKKALRYYYCKELSKMTKMNYAVINLFSWLGSCHFSYSLVRKHI